MQGPPKRFCEWESFQTRITWRKSQIGEGDSRERSSEAKTSQNVPLKEWSVSVTVVNKEAKTL